LHTPAPRIPADPAESRAYRSRAPVDISPLIIKLLVQVVPPEQREKVDPSVLHGPVVNPEGRTDVVTNQGEVDDLLASLGF